MSGPPGWYGKLAMLGDFASRRLDADWVAACDRWLAAGICASRESLGERWLAAYLAAPAWRFAWAPGVVDAQWWFGVLVPSCDRAGRYYPLVVAQSRGQAPADRVALDHLDAWWTQAVRAGVATLADGATLDGFEDALAALPPWPSASGPRRLRPLPAEGRERLAVAAGAGLADLAAALAATRLQQRLAGCSVWWPAVEPGAGGTCTLHAGLPPPQAFAALLSRDW